MKKILLLMLCLFSLSAISADQIDIRQVAGVYKGEVVNGGGVFTVTTTFTLLPDGRLRGEYLVDNGTNPLQGYLSSPIIEGKNSFSFEWSDRDGEGYAELYFSDDFSSFEGFWSSRQSPEQFPWTGERQ